MSFSTSQVLAKTWLKKRNKLTIDVTRVVFFCRFMQYLKLYRRGCLQLKPGCSDSLDTCFAMLTCAAGSDSLGLIGLGVQLVLIL